MDDDSQLHLKLILLYIYIVLSMQTWIHYFPKSTRVLAKYPHGDFYSTKYIHMIVNLSQNC